MDKKLGALPPVFNKYGLHLTTVAPSILTSKVLSQVNRYSEIAEWILGENDKIGDCTCVAIANTLLARSIYTNKTWRTPTPNIVSFYEKFGYNPALTQPNGFNPTDQGAIITNVLRTWLVQGFQDGRSLNKLIGFASVDPQNLNLLKQVVYTFGDVYLGVDLTIAQQTQAIWDFVPGSPAWGGHCIPIVGYLLNGNFVVASWGSLYEVTPAFIINQCIEAYCLLDNESITIGKQTFSDWNMDVLEQNIKMLGGTL